MHRTGRRGFSLVELLVAMGIFSMMGIAIVSLLSRASEFSRSGTSTTEQLDALQAITETFSADVAAIATRADAASGAPAVRLHSDLAKTDLDADGKADGLIRRLMFVRAVPDEATNPLTRTAGTVVGAKEYVDQSRDYEEAAKGALRPTGGLQELFWTAVPESKDDLAVMTLYRGVRSPIGGAGTFFPSKGPNDPSATGAKERGPADLKEIRAVARPVMTGVLYFGVEFWARRTETWDVSVAPPKGPLLVWDSTRGVLPKGSAYEGFFFARPSRTGEPSTVDDPQDDTFPRQLRVTFTVEETGSRARTGMLLADLSREAGTIDLSTASFIPGTDTTRRFVKIGPEWIEFQSIDGTRLTGCRRGARGTVAQAHPAGSKVHYGRTIVREVSVPTFRDTYRDELPAIGGRR